jgi:integration host factor subunit alpha
MTLTKADIVKEIYKNHNLTKAEATEAVESLLRLSKDTLVKGSNLLLSGFGKFNVRDKNPRRGRNPQTGEDLTLDARRVVTFKPSGILRNRINEG